MCTTGATAGGPAYPDGSPHRRTVRSAPLHLRPRESPLSTPNTLNTLNTLNASTPVVLVHGTRSSAAVWERQVTALRRRGVETRAIDLPAHGERVGETFTFPGAVAAIDDAVAASSAPPLLVGLSLGGYASLAYAGRRESTLAGLMFSACSTDLRPWVMHSYRHLSHHVTRTFRLGGGTWSVVEDMLRAMAAYDPLPDLRRLTLPLWMVNGQLDPMRFDERRFAAANPGITRTVVPRVGHDIHVEAPATYSRAILEALASLAGTADVRKPALVPAAAGLTGRTPAPAL